MGTSVFVRIFNEDGDRVLIVLNKTKQMPDGLMKPSGGGLPGGGKRDNETELEAAHRELKEETGLEADINPEHIFYTKKGNGQEIYVFAGKNPRGDLHPTDADILEALWVRWRWLEHEPKITSVRLKRAFPVYSSHLRYINNTHLYSPTDSTR